MVCCNREKLISPSKYNNMSSAESILKIWCVCSHTKLYIKGTGKKQGMSQFLFGSNHITVQIIYTYLPTQHNHAKFSIKDIFSISFQRIFQSRMPSEREKFSHNTLKTSKSASNGVVSISSRIYQLRYRRSMYRDVKSL